MHCGRGGGHFGGQRTFERVRERFYWPGYHRQVLEWCRRCEACCMRSGPARQRKAQLKTRMEGEPFRRIAMDILGPLPETDRGNKYVLVVGDYFTKWCEAYPVPNQEASTIACVFTEEWVSRYGVPGELHSDQGRNFESRLFAKTCQLLGIRKTRTTPLHPQSDGMVERMNRTLCGSLSKYVDKHHRDWDSHLPWVMMSYRSSVHDATKFSPSYLLFGREPRLPMDLICPDPLATAEESPCQYVVSLRERLQEAHLHARSNTKQAAVSMKAYYDGTARKQKLQPNDRVWLFAPARKRGLTPKFQSPWTGPFLVEEVISDQLCRVKIGRTTKTIHRNRLALHRGAQEEVLRVAGL